MFDRGIADDTMKIAGIKLPVDLIFFLYTNKTDTGLECVRITDVFDEIYDHLQQNGVACVTDSNTHDVLYSIVSIEELINCLWKCGTKLVTSSSNSTSLVY